VNALGGRGSSWGRSTPSCPPAARDLMLTIDLDVQRAAENAFEPGARGAVVAMDPRNGKCWRSRRSPTTTRTSSRWGSRRSAGTSSPAEAIYRSSTAPSRRRTAGLHDQALHGARGARERCDDATDVLSPRPCTGEFRFGTRLFGCWKHEGHGKPGPARRDRAVLRRLLLSAGKSGSGSERLSAFMAKPDALGENRDRPAQERKGSYPDPAWYDRRFGAGRWAGDHPEPRDRPGRGDPRRL